MLDITHRVWHKKHKQGVGQLVIQKHLGLTAHLPPSIVMSMLLSYMDA
jgi:hypothetical protein